MKTVFLYVSLVGLPALAIAGVLRAGQRLRSPVFVGGTWTVERRSKDSLCNSSLIKSDGAVLIISQTGSHLLLTLNDEDRTTFAGEIRDATITASAARPSSDAPVDVHNLGGVSIQFHAAVERGGGSDQLLGTLTFPDCPASAVMSFSAQRQAAGATQGR